MSVYQIMNKLRNRFQSLWHDRSAEIDPPTEITCTNDAYRKGYLAGYWTGVVDGVDVGVSEGVIEVENQPQLRA